MSLISMQHSAKRKITFLIIGLMGLMILNKVIFLHSHVLTDGTIISHAHPYHSAGSSNPVDPHHHTKAAFFFFDHFQLLYFSILTTLLLHRISSLELIILPKERAYQANYQAIHRNKAPPQFKIN